MSNAPPDNTIITDTPIGKIGVYLCDGKLVKISFLPEKSQIITPQNPTAQHIINELNQYLNNPRHIPAIICSLSGTPFQKKVWQALRKISVSSSITYGELAKQLQTSARAIGNACRHNPIPLIYPCHRVVAKNDLGGFSGNTQGRLLQIKKWLLQHEGALH